MDITDFQTHNGRQDQLVRPQSTGRFEQSSAMMNAQPLSRSASSQNVCSDTFRSMMQCLDEPILIPFLGFNAGKDQRVLKSRLPADHPDRRLAQARTQATQQYRRTLAKSKLDTVPLTLREIKSLAQRLNLILRETGSTQLERVFGPNGINAQSTKTYKDIDLYLPNDPTMDLESQVKIIMGALQQVIQQKLEKQVMVQGGVDLEVQKNLRSGTLSQQYAECTKIYRDTPNQGDQWCLIRCGAFDLMVGHIAENYCFSHQVFLENDQPFSYEDDLKRAQYFYQNAILDRRDSTSVTLRMIRPYWKLRAQGWSSMPLLTQNLYAVLAKTCEQENLSRTNSGTSLGQDSNSGLPSILSSFLHEFENKLDETANSRMNAVILSTAILETSINVEAGEVRDLFIERLLDLLQDQLTQTGDDGLQILWNAIREDAADIGLDAVVLYFAKAIQVQALTGDVRVRHCNRVGSLHYFIWDQQLPVLTLSLLPHKLIDTPSLSIPKALSSLLQAMQWALPDNQIQPQADAQALPDQVSDSNETALTAPDLVSQSGNSWAKVAKRGAESKRENSLERGVEGFEVADELPTPTTQSTDADLTLVSDATTVQSDLTDTMTETVSQLVNPVVSELYQLPSPIEDQVDLPSDRADESMSVDELASDPVLMSVNNEALSRLMSTAMELPALIDSPEDMRAGSEHSPEINENGPEPRDNSLELNDSPEREQEILELNESHQNSSEHIETRQSSVQPSSEPATETAPRATQNKPRHRGASKKQPVSNELPARKSQLKYRGKGKTKGKSKKSHKGSQKTADDFDFSQLDLANGSNKGLLNTLRKTSSVTKIGMLTGLVALGAVMAGRTSMARLPMMGRSELGRTDLINSIQAQWPTDAWAGWLEPEGVEPTELMINDLQKAYWDLDDSDIDGKAGLTRVSKTLSRMEQLHRQLPEKDRQRIEQFKSVICGFRPNYPAKISVQAAEALQRTVKKVNKLLGTEFAAVKPFANDDTVFVYEPDRVRRLLGAHYPRLNTIIQLNPAITLEQLLTLLPDFDRFLSVQLSFGHSMRNAEYGLMRIMLQGSNGAELVLLPTLLAERGLDPAMVGQFFKEFVAHMSTQELVFSEYNHVSSIEEHMRWSDHPIVNSHMFRKTPVAQVVWGKLGPAMSDFHQRHFSDKFDLDLLISLIRGWAEDFMQSDPRVEVMQTGQISFKPFDCYYAECRRIEQGIQNWVDMGMVYGDAHSVERRSNALFDHNIEDLVNEEWFQKQWQTLFMSKVDQSDLDVFKMAYPVNNSLSPAEMAVERSQRLKQSIENMVLFKKALLAEGMHPYQLNKLAKCIYARLLPAVSMGADQPTADRVLKPMVELAAQVTGHDYRFEFLTHFSTTIVYDRNWAEQRLVDTGYLSPGATWDSIGELIATLPDSAGITIFRILEGSSVYDAEMATIDYYSRKRNAQIMLLLPSLFSESEESRSQSVSSVGSGESRDELAEAQAQVLAEFNRLSAGRSVSEISAGMGKTGLALGRQQAKNLQHFANQLLMGFKERYQKIEIPSSENDKIYTVDHFLISLNGTVAVNIGYLTVGDNTPAEIKLKFWQMLNGYVQELAQTNPIIRKDFDKVVRVLEAQANRMIDRFDRYIEEDTTFEKCFFDFKYYATEEEKQRVDAMSYWDYRIKAV